MRGGEDGHEADAEVEGALKVAAGHPADAPMTSKTAGEGQVIRSDRAATAAGQDAGEVGGQATAGDVRERVDVDAGGADEREEVGGIHARGSEKLLTQRVPELPSTCRSSDQPAAAMTRRTRE